MYSSKYIVVSILLILSICACQQPKDTSINEIDTSTIQLFEKIDGAHSGINFRNDIRETADFNYLLYDGMYQGAGVAIGDINNDGLDDVFFASNMDQDLLYLNKGDLQFENITNKSGIGDALKSWSTGVTMADVNNDGWLDIYVCRFLMPNAKLRANQLFINNKDNTFTERAEEYGIADKGYSIMANFFDYDKDGDLDLYIANQPPTALQEKERLKRIQDYKYTDRLYQNNGNGKFVDVTKAAGVIAYTFSLSVTVSDLNQDGWPDIYVACDYEEPDMYFENNRDGTFTNKVHQSMKHLSNFAMGVDIADINNDGWMEIYAADMVAADNFRLKTNMSGMDPKKFWNLAKNGYHHQYMFNSLQLNNGNGTFSEIGQLAGVSSTDWSWSPLFADFDNDGYRDLVVTNGISKEMRNNDFNIERKKFMQNKLEEATQKGIKEMYVNPLEILKFAPSKRIDNFTFKNNGDLTFDNLSAKWGFNHMGWSHGSAYSDFDNDGDLDLIVNNMNDVATLYRNQASQLKLGNYLRVNVKNDKENPFSISAMVTIKYGEDIQVMEVSPVRGFMSTSERTVHFGLKGNAKVDELLVQWNDGTELILTDVDVNQEIIANKSKGKKNIVKPEKEVLFADITKQSGLDFIHQENEFDDYLREILLPYELSHQGPCLATGDVNNDGLTDIFIGGPSGQSGAIFLQNKNETFARSDQSGLIANKNSEDVGALFFDADGDKDLDLYVVSGGNDFNENDKALQDRLYLNDGTGAFTLGANRLPKMLTSGSKVSANDFDQDGDLDLFVGGRQVPGKYGHIPTSYLLQNNNGNFKDITDASAKGLSKIGMVTEGIWTDMDGDKDQDLVVTGEWMSIEVFNNENGTLTKNTSAYNLSDTEGWWNTVTATDIDNDGDQDLIAGNLGLNIKYKASKDQPFKVYVKDFDENGTNDVYLGYYDSDGICYPVRGRQCSSQQLPYIKKEFKTYNEFGTASIEKVLGERKEGAIYHEAKNFANTIFINNGGKFEAKNLPNLAQIAPIYGISVYDWNKDGNLDLFVAGNYYAREVETTRSDAGTGTILIGDGAGNFTPVPTHKSGINADQDVRDVKLILDNDSPLIIIGNNDGKTQVFKPTSTDNFLSSVN